MNQILRILKPKYILGYALFLTAPASMCPPNFCRMAESIFSAKVCCCRERKRTYNAAVNTSAGTASSSAA